MPYIKQKMEARHLVSFLKHMTTSALTDTRKETEYVENGTEVDAEKSALQIIE